MTHGTPRPHLVLCACLAVSIASIAACGGGEKSDSGIAWLESVDSGLAVSSRTGRPVMIDFTASWCPPCRAMEDSTFSDPAVIERSRSFVPVRIDVDEQRETAEEYGGNARKYGGTGIPNILFLSGSGRRLEHLVGFHGPDSLAAVMDSVLSIEDRR